ncbi:MAG TPA: pyruvate synthase subunit beta [Firmicutes bacterium]|nr:pyruvate synthase subunit beta [Bacillota bacterium]
MSRQTALNREEYLFSGHNACPGCGAAVTVRHLAKILGRNTVFVITASCFSVIAGPLPLRSFALNVFHCPFASAAAVGSGLRRGLKSLGREDLTVAVLAGDGGTFDIGLQGMSAAAERNEDILFVCYDNEAYMNTGMQRSSATPYGSITGTTPAPATKTGPKKDIMKILAAHRIPYAATATIAFPEDFQAKVEKAKCTSGFRFLHLLAPCPPGWGMESSMTVTCARRAVEAGIFPLYEMEYGRVGSITYKPEKLLPVGEYLALQNRFSALTAGQEEYIQKTVNDNWRALLAEEAKAGRS